MEQRPAALSIASADGDKRRRTSSAASQTGHLITSFGQRKASHGNPHFQVSSRKTSVTPRAEAVNTAASTGRLRAQGEVQASYRMEPHPDKKFRPNAAKKIMEEVLDEALEQLIHYEPIRCRSLTTQVCEDIKQKVKWLNFDRCKLVCLVYFGSLHGQGLHVASQCLWDHNVDNFASTTRTKANIFATALLFGIYKEWENNASTCKRRSWAICDYMAGLCQLRYVIWSFTFRAIIFRFPFFPFQAS